MSFSVRTLARGSLLMLLACSCLCMCMAGQSMARRPKATPKKAAKSKGRSHAVAQSQTESGIQRDRTKREAELRKLQQEIREYQAQLADHEKREKRSKQSISQYNKRTHELESMIASLQSQARQIEAERAEVDRSIVKTSSHLDSLKSAYGSAARFLYTHGALQKPGLAEQLFQTKHAREHDRLTYYTQVIGDAHFAGKRKLDSVKTELNEDKAELTESLNEQRTEISLKAKEESRVEQRKAEEAKALVQIQSDREKLRKELDKRKASAKRLEGLIADLVIREEKAREARAAERERKRKLAAKEKASGHSTKKYAPTKEEEFDARPSIGPHSLAWPSSTRKIKQGYGEHRNTELNTVTVNLGIDIAAPRGSSVMAAADGEVSLVSSLPSYGNIVVLRHPGGVHTVYADLDGVNVRQGAMVTAGQAIGRSGENAELGPLLHFEVWKGKAKQNPMGWLK